MTHDDMREAFEAYLLDNFGPVSIVEKYPPEILNGCYKDSRTQDRWEFWCAASAAATARAVQACNDWADKQGYHGIIDQYKRESARACIEAIEQLERKP